MKTLYKNNLYYLLIFLLAPIFFHLGYLLKNLLGLNNDIFFTHSFLLFVTVIIFTLIDLFINNKRFNEYVRLINISILSCSFFGIILSIIQNDIPHREVNTLDTLRTDKHLKKVNFFRKINHPSEGNILLPDTGIKINNKSLPVRKHQPSLGENSKEILEEIGYNRKEIKKIIDLNKK